MEALTAPGAAVGAFGILTRAVFGTAIREARGSIDKFGQGAESLGNRFTDLLGKTKNTAQANSELAASLGEVDARTLANTTTEDKRLRQLVALGKQQNLSTQDAKELNKLAVQSKLKNEELITSLKARGDLNETQREQLKSLEKRQKSLESAEEKSEKRIKSTNKAIRGLGVGIEKAGKGIAAAGRFTLGFIGGLATFITVASIVVTIGAQLAEAFGWTEAIGDFISEIVFQFKRLLGVTKELKEEAQVAKAADFVGPFGDDDKIKAGVFTRVIGNQDILGKKTGEQINEAIIDAAKKGLTGDALADEVGRSLFRGFDKGGVVLAPDVRAKIKAAGDNAAKVFGGGFTSGVAAFAEATGRTIETATRQLQANQQGAIRFRGTTGREVEFEQATDEDIKNEKVLKAINERNRARTAGLQIQELEVALQDKLNSGKATAESIEKSIGALTNKKIGL